MMERAISLCAHFIKCAAENGHRLGFAANCGTEDGGNRIAHPISGGFIHSKEIMRSLASLRITHASSIISLIESGMNKDLSMTEIYIVTPCANEAIDEAAAMLRRRNSVEVVRI